MIARREMMAEPVPYTRTHNWSIWMRTVFYDYASDLSVTKPYERNMHDRYTRGSLPDDVNISSVQDFGVEGGSWTKPPMMLTSL
jgi:hypothetical protein